MRIAICVLSALLASLPALGQTVSLRGQVTDQSGAVVPLATVTLNGPSGLVKTAKAANDGTYAFADLAPGNYTVQASAPDLALPQPAKIALKAGSQTLNLQLFIAATQQQVKVEDNAGPSVSTEAANNASAVILRGSDLDALSDNPDDFAADLQALAGPAAGPNGGSIFIDGFSGGQLPPKNAIREIRINQNPFSPEYDRLGFGRIEIFTKPGSDKFRGSVGYNFANDFWNSRNAYAAEKAPFHLNELSGNLSGPINKRASFNFNVTEGMGRQRFHHQRRHARSTDARRRPLYRIWPGQPEPDRRHPPHRLPDQRQQHPGIPLRFQPRRYPEPRHRWLQSGIEGLPQR